MCLGLPQQVEVSHLSAGGEDERPRELSLPISREQVERSCKPKDAGSRAVGVQHDGALRRGPDSKVILVTGAAGFVGRLIQLLSHEHGAVVLTFTILERLSFTML
eukprot:1176244-Prorocentrum_minimum.AAC.3